VYQSGSSFQVRIINRNKKQVTITKKEHGGGKKWKEQLYKKCCESGS
jgi:predicted secreted protein